MLGYLTIDETKRELVSFDYHFVHTVQPLLGIQLLRRMMHMKMRMDSQNELIRYLMSSHSHTSSELLSQCELYGFDASRNRVCAVIRLSDHNRRAQAQRRGLREAAYGVALDMLGKENHDHHIMPFQNNLILFFLKPHMAAEWNSVAETSETLEKIVQQLAKMDIASAAGVSKCYGGIDTLRLSLDQAFDALRLGQALDDGQTLYRYAEYQFSHLLSLALSQRQARELYNESFGRLERHDEKTAAIYQPLCKLLSETALMWQKLRKNSACIATLCCTGSAQYKKCWGKIRAICMQRWKLSSACMRENC